MNLQIGRAFGIVMRTLPYVAYRALVYGILCAVIAFLLLVLAVIGQVFGGTAAAVLFVLALAASRRRCRCRTGRRSRCG